MPSTVRRLTRDDRARLEAYLSSRPYTTIFLRSNLREAGLEGGEARWAATYVGVFDADELRGVAALYRNGMLILETDPPRVPELVRASIGATDRMVQGIIGTPDLVTAAHEALGIRDEQTRDDDVEILYRLELSRLRVPQPLASGAWTCRPALPRDEAQLIDWNHDYRVEALRDEPGEALRAEAAEGVRRYTKLKRLFVLSDGDELVSMTGFNAELPDVVQVGGVWTPPALRRRGYAGGAVAGSLLQRRAAGVAHSVLFTEKTNVPAQHCYERLGYQRIGHYQISFMKAPWRP